MINHVVIIPTIILSEETVLSEPTYRTYTSILHTHAHQKVHTRTFRGSYIYVRKPNVKNEQWFENINVILRIRSWEIENVLLI